jgi:F-type H+-transporting ATPase subunit delta
MKNPALVKKYADGLALAVKDDAEFAAVGGEVRAFLDLFQSRDDLRQALTSPFVNIRKKQAVLAEILARLAASPKATRLLGLILEHKRMELLPDIVAALPEAWADMKGILTFEVASAVAMTEAQRDRLRRDLEASEGRPVRLVFKIEPGLVGGLAVRKGHIVYDASVEGTLAALQERLGHS